MDPRGLSDMTLLCRFRVALVVFDDSAPCIILSWRVCFYLRIRIVLRRRKSRDADLEVAFVMMNAVNVLESLNGLKPHATNTVKSQKEHLWNSLSVSPKSTKLRELTPVMNSHKTLFNVTPFTCADSLHISYWFIQKG